MAIVLFYDTNGVPQPVDVTDGSVHVLLSDGVNTASVENRTQTPSGAALNVQIGPGDPISNIPVVMEFEHHQIHEGETYLSFQEQLSIGTNTVKYAIVCLPNKQPHMVVSIDAYNGSCIVRLFHTSTFTGGGALAAHNRNRNSLNSPTTVVHQGVTSTNGTQFEALLAGTGKTSGGSQRSVSEFILKSGATYRVDCEGLDAGVKAIVRFSWYEDLGV
jgi:hypothetical protein